MLWYAALTLLLAFLLHRLFVFASTRGLPGVVDGAIPLLGHGIQLARGKQNFLLSCQKKYGRVFTLSLGGRNQVFTTEREGLAAFFKCPENKISFMQLLDDLGFTAFISGGLPLKDQSSDRFAMLLRADILPKLSQFEKVVKTEVARYIKEDMQSQGVLEGFAFARKTVGNAASKIFVHCQLPDVFFDKLYKCEKGITKGVAVGTISKFLQRKELVEVHKLRAEMVEILLPFVKDLRQKLETREVNEESESRIASLMELLLENVEGITDTSVAVSIISAFFAAQTNTVSACAQTLILLLENEKCKEQVIAELKSSLKDKSDITSLSTENTPLFDMCLQECFRLCSSMMGPSRMVVNQPYKLITKAGTAYDLPVGTILSVPSSNLNYDTEFWKSDLEELYTFNPHRWEELSKYDRSIAQYATAPFGYGLHACPGRYLANMEIKVIVGMVLLATNMKPEKEFPPIELDPTAVATRSGECLIGYAKV